MHTVIGVRIKPHDNNATALSTLLGNSEVGGGLAQDIACGQWSKHSTMEQCGPIVTDSKPSQVKCFLSFEKPVNA